MPEAATGGVLYEKKLFFKMSQNSQEVIVSGNTYEFCKIFKNNFFTEQLWRTTSEMQTLQ